MIAFSKKYVTTVVAVVAVVTIAIAMVYSQKKKSSYNALASSAADGVNPSVIGGETLDRDVWEMSRRYFVSLRSRTAGGVIYHSCGATLISSRVVLTAARELKSAQKNIFVMYYAAALYIFARRIPTIPVHCHRSCCHLPTHRLL